MLKLIKYELKGLYKDIIIMVSSIIILNLLLYTRINSWQSGSIIACSSLIGFAAMIIVFIWNIMLFSRDMYQDSGYLLFSIPEKGCIILGAKVLTALIQAVFIGCIAFIFNYITYYTTEKVMLMQISNALHLINIKGAVFVILASIFQYIYLLILIYFCISLSKMAIKSRRFGKLGSFIIFIVISIILAKLLETIVFIFPQCFDLTLLSTDTGILSVNISSVIFSILTFILFFTGCSYILENKIDL